MNNEPRKPGDPANTAADNRIKSFSGSRANDSGSPVVSDLPEPPLVADPRDRKYLKENELTDHEYLHSDRAE